jgi:predicted dehydrogenase
MTQSPRLSVGLVGAGPWARKAYAPMLAAGPETRLAAVWARRPEAARELAVEHQTHVAARFEELLETSDAVAFAVPPDVQAGLAIRAAHAGKHLMLDKPLALTPDDARRLTDAVDEAGVVTQLMLTQRFRPTVRAFIDSARSFGAIGARLAFLSGAFVRGPYATPWRKQHGALHDLGPHAFDLLESALGRITRIRGCGDPRRWVALDCEHESGAVSSLTLTGIMEWPESVFRIELYNRERTRELDVSAASAEEPWSAARRAFADAVRAGRSSDLDVHRGLHLQELIASALQALG